MILVIGGRSKIGSALIERLLERGEEVRALSRAGEGSAPWPDGVEVVTGDLADPGSLRTAMAGAARVFLLCGPTPDEVAFNLGAIDAARAAGVALIVRSSIMGADSASAATFVRDHGLCDEYLRAAGIPFAIVRPNLFTQNIPESTIPSIDPSGTFYANAGAARISMVDTRDVAEVAAALLTSPEPAGEELDVTGPEALSYHDVAVRLSAALGRPVTYVEADDDAVAGALAGYGIGDWMVGGLVELYQEHRRSGTDGYASALTDTVERLTGHPARSLDALLAESQPAGVGMTITTDRSKS
jgi:uncharacterized protein YbjT (DUF2867 family)